MHHCISVIINIWSVLFHSQFYVLQIPQLTLENCRSYNVLSFDPSTWDIFLLIQTYNSFNNVYSFLRVNSALLLSFISKCFPFDVIINGNVFLNSFLHGSLKVYGNTIDIYILILYPAKLLNLLILMVFQWNPKNLYMEDHVICKYSHPSEMLLVQFQTTKVK